MFECNKCGACCRQAKMLLSGFDFPHKFLEDGSCEHYDETVGCKIYETRPDMCRVEVAQKIYGTEKGMPEEEYYNLTKACCNQLMDYLNMDISLRYKL